MFQIVQRVISKFKLSVSSNKFTAPCYACLQAKSHQLPFYSSTHKSMSSLELVFSDVWGPSLVVPHLDNKYYVSFINSFSCFTWLFPIQCKSDVYSLFVKFQAFVERQFNTKIKCLQSDWGGNIGLFTPTFKIKASNIACPAHTLINKMGVWSESIALS